MEQPSLKVNIKLPRIDLELDSLKNKSLFQPKCSPVDAKSDSNLSDRSLNSTKTPVQGATKPSESFIPPFESLKKIEPVVLPQFMTQNQQPFSQQNDGSLK